MPPTALLFLPVLLILIALLMVSNIPYPSLKTIGSQTRIDFRWFILLLIVLTAIYLFHFLAIALVFLGYIFFGIGRHAYRHRRRRSR